MRYEDEGHVFNFIAGLAFGAVIGAGLALLMAPEKGIRTRRRIRRAAEDFREVAGDRWEDLRGDVRHRVEGAVEGARKRLP